MCGITAASTGYKTPRLINYTAQAIKYLSMTGCGTDSYGLSAQYPKGFLLIKNVGTIPVKGVTKIAKKYVTETGSVIGHTRMATTGDVNAKNAHPFVNELGNLAMVHNGIVSDYENKRKKLEFVGHKFSSDTDSEVLLHQFEENIKGKELTVQNLADTLNDTCNGISMANTIIQMRDGTLLAFADSRLSKNVGKDSVLIATKPITDDVKNWSDLKPNTVLIAKDGNVLLEKTYESRYRTYTSRTWKIGKDGVWRWDDDLDELFDKGRMITNDKGRKMVLCIPETGRGKPHQVKFRKAYYCNDCGEIHCKGHRHTDYIEKLSDVDHETLDYLLAGESNIESDEGADSLVNDRDIDRAIETYSPSSINRMIMKKDEERYSRAYEEMWGG